MPLPPADFLGIESSETIIRGSTTDHESSSAPIISRNLRLKEGLAHDRQEPKGPFRLMRIRARKMKPIWMAPAAMNQAH